MAFLPESSRTPARGVLATRFSFLLLEQREQMAVRLLADGAPYWAADGGTLVVARAAVILNLSKRETVKVCALLDIRPQQAVQTLAREAVDPVLLPLLQLASEVPVQPPEPLPMQRARIMRPMPA